MDGNILLSPRMCDIRNDPVSGRQRENGLDAVIGSWKKQLGSPVNTGLPSPVFSSAKLAKTIYINSKHKLLGGAK